MLLPKLINYSVPFGIIAVTGFFVSIFERSMTLRLYGSNELGIYSASARIALLISLIVFSFQTAWGPFALSIYKKRIHR